VVIFPQQTTAVVSSFTPLDCQSNTAGTPNTVHDQIIKTIKKGLDAPPPLFRYILQASSEAAPDLSSKQCLLVVQASHNGLRDAFWRLKQIASINPPAVIGITISHANDSNTRWGLYPQGHEYPQGHGCPALGCAGTARDHYNKLAIAAQRFLGLSIHSYGSLYEAYEPWAQTNLQTNPQEDSINNIAKMIISDWYDYQRSKTKGRNIL